jgi:hypothetical protein
MTLRLVPAMSPEKAPAPANGADRRTLVERVRESIAALEGDGCGRGCAHHRLPRVWARGVGPHVLLGFQGEEAFARLTRLGSSGGGGLYALAFRAAQAVQAGQAGQAGQAWEPPLFVDALPDIVGHALVAMLAEGEAGTTAAMLESLL